MQLRPSVLLQVLMLQTAVSQLSLVLLTTMVS
jgi:hypothetical protein